MNNQKLYYFSDAKFLKLDISIPHEEILEECKKLKNRFTNHRGNSHNGWKSLSLYGLAENKHESWQDYNYSSAIEAAKDFVWTTAADDCPITVNWLKNNFPCQRFGRVRFMLVEAGGHIGLHSDTKYRILENINISVSNPKNCIWQWGDGEELFMEPGNAYAMNISYEHAVYNRSNEDRFHLIVARHDSTLEWQKLINDAAKKSNIVGHYEQHEIAV